VQEYVEIGSGGLIEKENLVEFHLLYSGPLHSAGYEQQRKEKHAIRKVFHSQLRYLWQSNRNLRRLAQMMGAGFYMQRGQPAIIPGVRSEQDTIAFGLAETAKNWNRSGFNFMPLVTGDLCLRCSLDILFLRMEERNYVLQGGDIDGRLKILFDSLRMADNASELPAGVKPENDEEPFFCLLQNDDLISEVRVNADQLLLLPGTKERDKHDVYLQIAVSLNTTTKLTQTGWAFE
jgi:hypothetical protein